MSAKNILFGFVLGLSVQFLLGATSTSELEREVSRLKDEVSESNQYLSNISRSLDRIDDSFGSSYLNIKEQK